MFPVGLVAEKPKLILLSLQTAFVPIFAFFKIFFLFLALWKMCSLLQVVGTTGCSISNEARDSSIHTQGSKGDLAEVWSVASG